MADKFRGIEAESTTWLAETLGFANGTFTMEEITAGKNFNSVYYESIIPLYASQSMSTHLLIVNNFFTIVSVEYSPKVKAPRLAEAHCVDIEFRPWYIQTQKIISTVFTISLVYFLNFSFLCVSIIS